jgi:hypothetical protein
MPPAISAPPSSQINQFRCNHNPLKPIREPTSLPQKSASHRARSLSHRDQHKPLKSLQQVLISINPEHPTLKPNPAFHRHIHPRGIQRIPKDLQRVFPDTIAHCTDTLNHN